MTLLDKILYKFNYVRDKNYKEYKPYLNLSFSQEGEDLILHRLLKGKKRGFYVDIGAHHPHRFSNTYKFYLEGWVGINIDPLPGSMHLFNKLRPNDINIEMAILNDNSTSSTYYMFDEPAYNTFNKTRAQEVSLYAKLINQKEVVSMSLEKALDSYLPENTVIDFISIDVEGYDLQVLQSNNWDRYRPTFIVIESLENSLENLSNTSIHGYLVSNNYKVVAKAINSLVYTIGY